MRQSIEIGQVSALVVAYQRPKNVESIMEKIIESGIKEIYVSLDFPKYVNSKSLKRRQEIIDIVKNFSLDPNIRIRLSFFSKNVGCGVAVISACDWFFDSVDVGIVLEDDCIPTPGFFSYMTFALHEVKSFSNVFVASGSRLHPHAPNSAEWELNNFPIFWGWGTNSAKWKFLSSYVKNPLPRLWRYPSPFSIRSIYWRAGSRRIREGFVDTWDTLISEVFHRLNLKNVSPKTSFVKNIGDDEFATHDMTSVKNLPVATETFDVPNSSPVFLPDENSLCGEYLYRYGFRHFFTTNFTKMMDRTINAPNANLDFITRLRDSKLRYHEIDVTR